MNRMTSRVWYLLAAGLILTAISIAGTGIRRFFSTVEGMHRVVMPGQAEIVLPEGPSTLYVEHSSIVDGKAYVIGEDLSFRCALTGPGGEELAITPSPSRVTYATGSYAGRNAFNVGVPAAGTYVLACEAPDPFVMAIGRGVGSVIVVAVVGGLVPGLLGLLVFILVLVKRSGQKRRAAAAAAAAAASSPAT